MIIIKMINRERNLLGGLFLSKYFKIKKLKQKLVFTYRCSIDRKFYVEIILEFCKLYFQVSKMKYTKKDIFFEIVDDNFNLVYKDFFKDSKKRIPNSITDFVSKEFLGILFNDIGVCRVKENNLYPIFCV